jgi:hypothetical protein
VDCKFPTLSKVDEVEELLFSKMNAIRITEVKIAVNEEQSYHLLKVISLI